MVTEEEVGTEKKLTEEDQEHTKITLIAKILVIMPVIMNTKVVTKTTTPK